MCINMQISLGYRYEGTPIHPCLFAIFHEINHHGGTPIYGNPLEKKLLIFHRRLVTGGAIYGCKMIEGL